MTFIQTPISHRLEYLAYLGLVGPWVSLITLIIPSNWLIDQAAIFITILSSLLALLLFIARIDRKLNPYIIKKMENELKIIKSFMAQVCIFLRMWEYHPIRVASFQKQVEQAAEAAIEGEDIHSDVWIQKNHNFLTYFSTCCHNSSTSR